MSKKPNNKIPLRASAEAKLASAPLENIQERSASELLHELRVHQIELEMQNEELRRAQVALEQSRDRYVALYDFAPVGYLTLNQQSLISEINLSGAALLGKERGKLIHDLFSRFISPADADRWHRHFIHTLQQDSKQSCELVLQRNDGTRFHALLDCLRQTSGSDMHEVRVTLTDISERWQAEEALRLNNLHESEEIVIKASQELDQLKYAMDQHSIVAITDVHGTITYVNDKFCSLSQYSRAELIGQNHRILNSGTHPQDFFRNMFHQIAAGNVWHGDCCNRAKDGSLYWVATTIVPYIGRDGKPMQYIAIRTDITALKKAEAILMRYKLVIDSSMDGFWVTDTKGNLSNVNQAYAAMSGYTVAELNKMNISQLEAQEQPEEVAAHIEKIISLGHDRFESQHRRRGGQIIDIEASVTFLPETQQFYVFCRDITERKRIEQTLKLNKIILDTTGEGFWLVDLSGHVIEVNQAYAKMVGYTRDELVGMHISKISVTSNTLELVNANIQRVISQGHVSFETRHRHKEGQLVDIEASITYSEKAKFLFSFLRDITERKKNEEALRVAAITFEMHDAIMITDLKPCIIQINQAFTDITGYSPQEVLGRNPRILSSGRQDKAFYKAMWRQLLDTGSWSGEMWDRHKDGHIYPKHLTISAIKNDAGELTQYVAMFNDITERKQAEDEIRNLAFYDGLTSLPNRRLLLDRFQLALSMSARNQQYGALLFLDMDKFKTLNDTLGHDYGDLMLIDVARRIQSCVREVDTVARLGGDEFVVVIEEIAANLEEASQKVALIAEKIRYALAEPYLLKEHKFHSSPSIGVCMFRGNAETMDALLKHADMAMYQAKDSGRNTVRFFDPVMQQAVEIHAALEADLRHAVPEQQLRLYYQIQVDNDHQAVGVEALVRWMHPTQGLVYPAHFIAVAEESSLILEIGFWVLETACQQLAKWSTREQTRELTIAVNVSAQQFRSHNYVAEVEAVLNAYQVDPSRLKLELTESVVLNDVADIVAKMHALKELGIKFSLDDFGTGYSSLSYLKLLPLDQIKIDQSFVRDITNDPNDAVLVRAIIDMARNFRLNVIAEGVETAAQLDFLQSYGCMAYQGYLFGKPLPVDEFERLLDESLSWVRIHSHDSA